MKKENNGSKNSKKHSKTWRYFKEGSLPSQKVQKLLHHLPSQMALFGALIFLAGLRLIEVLGLRWEHSIDWKRRWLLIDNKYAKNRKGCHIVICPALLEWLRLYKKNQGKIIDIENPHWKFNRLANKILHQKGISHYAGRNSYMFYLFKMLEAKNGKWMMDQKGFPNLDKYRPYPDLADAVKYFEIYPPKQAKI